MRGDVMIGPIDVPLRLLKELDEGAFAAMVASTEPSRATDLEEVAEFVRSRRAALARLRRWAGAPKGGRDVE